MEGSTTVFVVLAVIGAGAAVVTFVVQEILRASGRGVTRTRLEAILQAMEAVVYDAPHPSGAFTIGSADPWGERGPKSVEEARNVLLQTLSETPIDHLAADPTLWRRVHRMLVVSRPDPPARSRGEGRTPPRPPGR